MRITYKWWNDGHTETSTTEAEKVKTYKGHDIYQDAQGWLYVETPDEGWRYFGTMGEAKTFINDLAN